MKAKPAIMLWACLVFAPTCAFAAKISYFKGTSNEEMDAAVIARLTKQGHTVTEFLPAGVPEADELAEVKDKDLVIISETIGSTQVLEPEAAGGVFTLRNWPKPVLSFEPYMWDEAAWSIATTQFEDFGNTGRPEITDAVIQPLLDTLYIKNASHPMAAGLSGAVKVYKEKFSFNFGKTPAGAIVIGTADAGGKYASHFVIPKGAKLHDGSTTPERRIGLFFAQGSGITDDPPGTLLKWEFLSDQGLALFDAAVKFALGDGSTAKTTAKALFIGGAADPSQGGDGDVWEFLKKRYGAANLTYKQASASQTADANNVDVVILSSTPGSGDMRGKFRDVKAGVLNWEEALCEVTRDGNFAFNDGNRTKSMVTTWKITDNKHPITSGLTLANLAIWDPDAETWGAEGEIPSSVQVLAKTPDDLPALMVAEAGTTQLGGVKAVGRRVMFPMTDATASSFTPKGWDLFGKAVDWAAGIGQSASGPALATGGVATSKRDELSFEYNDTATSKLDAKTIALKVDGATVTPTVTAAGGKTTITYKPSPVWPHGSSHTYELTAKESGGKDVGVKGDFKLPAPPFPEADLNGPKPVDNAFAVRYIWNTGTSVGWTNVFRHIDGAGKAGFAGKIFDTTHPTMDYGNGGAFADNLEYPEKVTGDADWTGEDFIQLAIANIEITQAGAYSFGVQSDDGFGLRIKGLTFTSKGGAARIETLDPSSFTHSADTGNSNSHVVAKDVKPGIYRLEWFWWERGGGDFGELYVAKGEFTEHAATDTWKLIGDPAGPVKLTSKAPSGSGGTAQSGLLLGSIGYWRMDETSGNVASDSSGKGNNGTIKNPSAAVWTKDADRGQVFKANGTAFIDFGVILPAMTLDSNFTWSLWTKSDETDNNNIVFGNRFRTNGADFAPREFIKFTPRKFEWHFDGAGQDADGEDIPVGEWVHNLVVKKGDTLTYYRNTEENATSTISGAPVNPQPLYLGGQSNQERWRGLADEVAIWNRALSLDEVKQVYNLGKAGKALSESTGGPPTTTAKPLLGKVSRSSSALGVTVTAAAGSKFDVEYSQDLKTWQVIAPDQAGTGQALTLEDKDATRLGRKLGFYRAKAK